MTELHLLASTTARLPRDAFGRRSSPSGRALLLDAARRVAGPAGAPARGADRRWCWPGGDWRGSVSHAAEFGLAALARGVWIGVDVQDQRPRPAALRWLARVLERPAEQVTLREWAETEALLKAQGTAAVRPERVELPLWRPGWRPTADGWWLRSGRSPDGLQLAVAAREPLTPRWIPPDGPHPAATRQPLTPRRIPPDGPHPAAAREPLTPRRILPTERSPL